MVERFHVSTIVIILALRMSCGFDQVYLECVYWPAVFISWSKCGLVRVVYKVNMIIINVRQKFF